MAKDGQFPVAHIPKQVCGRGVAIVPSPIWKNIILVSDFRNIFYIHILTCYVTIVLVASTIDAIGPQARYGKIKLLDFSVNGLWILSVIDIHNSSVSHL